MAKLINNLFIVLVFSCLVASCDDNNPSNLAGAEVSKEFQASSDSIEDLQDEISRKIILSSSDSRSKQLTRIYLVDLKNLLTFLSANPGDKASVYRALEITKKFEDLPLPLADRARIDPILKKYGQAIARHAKTNKIDVSKFNWSIFSYDFSDGLDLFWTVATKADWLTTDGNSVNNQTKATARASKFDPNKAWLVSPKFDFTDLKNPELVLRHSIQISRGDEPLNTAEVLEQGYKVLVTDKLEFGDKLIHPNLICPAQLFAPMFIQNAGECIDDSIWEELKVNKPKGDDFHTITTKPVSLKKYAGKKNVFIALLLNLDSKATKDIGKHFNNWSVYEFKLLGSGVLPTPEKKPPPPKPIFVYDFPNQDLSPLLTFQSDPNTNSWRFGTFKDFNYASMTTENGPNTAYDSTLVFPNMDLTTDSEQLFLNIDHSVRPAVDTYDFWSRLKVKISTDYVDGSEPSTANWSEFEIKTNDKIRYDGFNKLRKYGIDISEYINQSISISFEFNAEVNDNHLWQVNKVSITPNKLD